MKIGIIAIVVMVLIASAAVAMAKQGDSRRVWIEGNKIMFLHYFGNDETEQYNYTINLTGPTDSEVNPIRYNTTEYSGEIGRVDVGTDKAKLFTVLFSDKDDPSNPTGDEYGNYSSIGGTEYDTPFELNDTFDGEICVYDRDGNVTDINGDDVEGNCLSGEVEIIEEEEE